MLAAERADRRPALRQQVEVCFASLKRVFGLGGTLATTLVGIAAEVMTAYTYGCYASTVCVGQAEAAAAVAVVRPSTVLPAPLPEGSAAGRQQAGCLTSC